MPDDTRELDTFMSSKIIRDMRRQMEELRTDAKAPARISLQLCHACFYLRRGVVGQGFTGYVCAVCQHNFMHENTGTPKLCRGCAEKLGRCRKCGADIEEVSKEAERG